ncbi:MAG: rod-binding protein [Verrucomicrobiota bacterium]
MEINSATTKVDASMIAPERLAGNSQLTKQEKVAEASRQFEAVLLRQILENSQKTVIKSSYADNSTSSAIYRDQFVSQMADSISKAGTFGFAKTFEQQLNRPAERDSSTNPAPAAAPLHLSGAAAQRGALSSHLKTP